jgi:hypothetical protein
MLVANSHADRTAAPIHRLDGAPEDLPCRTKARRSFSGARQPTSVAPAPVKDFQSAPPTLRALDRDKSPLVSRADAPKNAQPAAPLHGENGRDADFTPVHRARVPLDCAPVGQDLGKPPPAGLDRPAGAQARRRTPSATPSEEEPV